MTDDHILQFLIPIADEEFIKNYPAEIVKAGRLLISVLATSMTDEMVRAALSVEYPALYADSLYKDGDGPSTRATTEKRVRTIREQFKRALDASAE